MMSPMTLERVSVAYRRGYYDGYNGTNQGAAVKPEYIKPFADYDYQEGLRAGANDARCERKDDLAHRSATPLECKHCDRDAEWRWEDADGNESSVICRRCMETLEPYQDCPLWQFTWLANDVKQTRSKP